MIISKIIGELKSQQTSLAHDAMKLPKPDPFEHGRIVGQYAGIQVALDLIDSILRDTENQS